MTRPTCPTRRSRLTIAAALVIAIGIALPAYPQAGQPARRIIAGAALPLSCVSSETIRDVFYRTDAPAGIFVCTAPDIWTQQTNASFATGPASSTDDAVARFDGTTGKTLQNSVLIVSDAGAVSGVSTFQTSGNAGFGTAPSATTGRLVEATSSGNYPTRISMTNADAAGADALANINLNSSGATGQMSVIGGAAAGTLFGQALANQVTVNALTGTSMTVGTIGAIPLVLGTNSLANLTIASGGPATFSSTLAVTGAITPNQTAGIVGTTTNNNANAGSFGEVVSATIAVGSAVALTTGTTANITSVSLTAGDWDCSGVVDYTFGATTSITNLVQGISTTSATLGAQDTFSDFETAANVMTATNDPAFVTPVVRQLLAATTTVYLVAQAKFTVSTASAYGTIRCRRMR